MGLFTELINQQKAGKHKSFWGNYSRLGHIDQQFSNQLTDDYLWRLQINKMRILESNERYVWINYLIKDSFRMLAQHTSHMQKEIPDAIMKRAMSLLNAGLWGNRASNPVLLGKNQEERKNIAKQEMQELSMLLSSLQIDKPLQKEIIDNIEKRLAVMMDTSIKNRNANYEYIQSKARHAEEIVTSIFKNNRDLLSFTTGSWKDKMGKSLIEDTMVFYAKDQALHTTNKLLGYTVHIKGRKSERATATSLNDFFNQINSLNTQYTITLSDELYTILQNASILNAQSKSGLSQSLLTSASRNAISLKDLGFYPSQLYNLYMDEKAKKYFKVRNANSKTLMAYANYALSRGIAKTNLKRNDIYFTKDGLVTASRWMELNKELLKFTGGTIHLDNEFLTKTRRYGFFKKN